MVLLSLGLVGLYLVLEYTKKPPFNGMEWGFLFLLTEGIIFKFDTAGTHSKVAELYILMFSQHLCISSYRSIYTTKTVLLRFTDVHTRARCKITQKPVGIKKRKKEFWCITITPLPSAVSNTISTSAPVSQVHASPALPTPLS